MFKFASTYLVGFTAYQGISIVDSLKKELSLAFICRAFLFQGSYRFFPFCFQVQINSNLSLSFITLVQKFKRCPTSDNLRPCKTEGLITTDRAVGKKRMSEKRDLN
jgi:hypothetical protein